MSNRHERVAEEIKKVVSETLRTKVSDPDIGMITVTDVELTKEMEIATIYFTSLNENREEVEAALGRSKGLVRSEVAREIRIRKAPELQFKYDTSIEYGHKIENLLNEIKDK
ncbi:30S ribosome-binding factor RbfA [Salinicoccus hispanicus]|uniref:Ribosome-binding factor A n=1 Tax=Salinicoccus hispanicus TaxID=157225 RepID=A0A6N8TVG6_9STAP|nr:30S ribosome-binding factor RbfA [Salinicoccus hispanicus]MXQ49894.1 30S ribosome-binding factor RbfA [Salinicoccus hispanicus]